MESEFIDYEDQGVELEGYFVTPDKEKERPLILVSHDWTGRRQYAINKANEMAALGYAAFAVDMYGKGVFVRMVMQILIVSLWRLSRVIGLYLEQG